MDDSLAPAFYTLTDDDHAAWAVIAAIACLVYSILFVGGKIVIRFNITSLKSHDILLVFATLLFVAEVICVGYASKTGLGQRENNLTSPVVERFNKFKLVLDILSIAIFGCAKISICLFISTISNQGSLFVAQRVTHGINQGRLYQANRIQLAVIVGWIISGIFAIAFECSVPRVWSSTGLDTCPRRGHVHVYNGIMNIITDLSLCMLPVAMMWKVHTSYTRKLQVILLFGTRIIVPMAVMPSIITGWGLYSADADVTFLLAMPMAINQIILSLSIITACIPSLKSIIDSLLGSTAGATIHAPYELTAMGGKGNLKAVALPEPGSKSRSKDEPMFSRGHGNFRQYHDVIKSNPQTQCFTDKKTTVHVISESDSTKNLTEGVIVRSDRFELRYEGGKRASDSSASLNSDYHQHI